MGSEFETVSTLPDHLQLPSGPINNTIFQLIPLAGDGNITLKPQHNPITNALDTFTNAELATPTNVSSNNLMWNPFDSPSNASGVGTGNDAMLDSSFIASLVHSNSNVAATIDEEPNIEGTKHHKFVNCDYFHTYI